MKHIKQGFSLKAWVQSPGWTLGMRWRPKHFVQNMVVLHIKLKGMKGNRTYMQMFVWFDLILYIPVNNFSVMLVRVFLGLGSTKQQINFFV